jgi:chloramphenicol O-acetyltransferase
MFTSIRSLLLLSVLTFITCVDVANAQGPNRRLFGNIASSQIAGLDEVVKEVGITDEQKKKIETLTEEMIAEFGDIFQEAQGDFDKIGREIQKLQSVIHKDLLAVLDEKQRERMQQIYVQVNNGCVLTDDSVVKALEITDDQKKKIASALQSNQQEVFGVFQQFQSMSEEEQAKKQSEIIEARDKAMIDVLTDEQKTKHEAAKGQVIEIDLSKIPMPGM